MKMQRFIAGLLGLVASASVYGGEFSFVDVDGPACEQMNGSTVCLTLLYSGLITKGDNQKLISEMKRSTQIIEESILSSVGGRPGARVGKIFFNSPGGDLFEAMKVGQTIRDNLIVTQVPSNSSCYSSCVIAYLGGVFRVPVGRVGVHSFYSKDLVGPAEYASASKRYDAVSAEVEAYLKAMRIPTTFLDEMKNTPHYSVKVLEFEEMRRLGVAGIDPVYAQVRQSSRDKPK